MILPRPTDALHKAWLYRLLMGLIDDFQISERIYFKGGTCAAILNFSDRFSVDLDFDLDPQADEVLLRKKLRRLFGKIDLEVKDESRRALQFFLKYPSPPGKRNTIKLDIIDATVKANEYRPFYLQEIDRTAICQTKETMFANKLVTVVDRYEKSRRRARRKEETIAGRDIYDIHHFFSQGFGYSSEVIKERTRLEPKQYLKELHRFIEKRVTQKIVDQDLNVLLPSKKFNAIRKTLKQETLVLIGDEIRRLG